MGIEHDDGQPSKASSELDSRDTSKLDKDSQKGSQTIASNSLAFEERLTSKKRSTSRDSSLNDDPKSINDSISAFSGRQNWSNKDLPLDGDDPSISSIKGDSISATIADYNRKHRSYAPDNQSRASGRLAAESTSRIDDVSVNINYYAVSSTSGILAGNQGTASKSGDFASLSSNANVDAFDVIEESSDTSIDDIERLDKPPDRLRSKKRQHNQSRTKRDSSLVQALEIDDLPPETVYQIEPIVIRGNGNLTLFGLSNSFSSEFPSALIGRVSKEEFDRTIRQVNSLLNNQQSLSAKILLFGGLFCCCSLGFSLVWPSITLKKRSKVSLEKLLASENSRLYSKLGLNWKLAEQRCYSNHAFVEYVLLIEFKPKLNLYLPD